MRLVPYTARFVRRIERIRHRLATAETVEPPSVPPSPPLPMVDSTFPVFSVLAPDGRSLAFGTELFDSATKTFAVALVRTSRLPGPRRRIVGASRLDGDYRMIDTDGRGTHRPATDVGPPARLSGSTDRPRLLLPPGDPAWQMALMASAAFDLALTQPVLMLVHRGQLRPWRIVRRAAFAAVARHLRRPGGSPMQRRLRALALCILRHAMDRLALPDMLLPATCPPVVHGHRPSVSPPMPIPHGSLGRQVAALVRLAGPRAIEARDDHGRRLVLVEPPEAPPLLIADRHLRARLHTEELLRLTVRLPMSDPRRLWLCAGNVLMEDPRGADPWLLRVGEPGALLTMLTKAVGPDRVVAVPSDLAAEELLVSLGFEPLEGVGVPIPLRTLIATLFDDPQPPGRFDSEGDFE